MPHQPHHQKNNPNPAYIDQFIIAIYYYPLFMHIDLRWVRAEKRTPSPPVCELDLQQKSNYIRDEPRAFQVSNRSFLALSGASAIIYVVRGVYENKAHIIRIICTTDLGRSMAMRGAKWVTWAVSYTQKTTPRLGFAEGVFFGYIVCVRSNDIASNVLVEMQDPDIVHIMALRCGAGWLLLCDRCV